MRDLSRFNKTTGRRRWSKDCTHKKIIIINKHMVFDCYCWCCLDKYHERRNTIISKLNEQLRPSSNIKTYVQIGFKRRSTMPPPHPRPKVIPEIDFPSAHNVNVFKCYIATCVMTIDKSHESLLTVL